MSKPRDAEHLRQLATWVPAAIKDELQKRAAADKKAERDVVVEALTAHLRSSVTAARPGKKAGSE